MNLTHIAFAVAALGVASAHAHTLSTAHSHSLNGLTAAGIPASNQIFISGSSALSGSMIWSGSFMIWHDVVRAMCNGVVTTSSCDSAGVTVRCTSGTADSGFSNQPFAVIKRDIDRSLPGWAM